MAHPSNAQLATLLQGVLQGIGRMEAAVTGRLEAVERAGGGAAQPADLASAISASLEPKQHNGQLVRPYDFDPTTPHGEVFNYPVEPTRALDHAQIVKNEDTLFSALRTTRVKPDEAPPSYWDRKFFALASSPFKEPLKFPEQRGWGAVSAPAKALIAAMLVKKPEVTKPPSDPLAAIWLVSHHDFKP